MGIIECYGLYVLALIAFAIVHELTHFIVAYILGFRPRLKVHGENISGLLIGIGMELNKCIEKERVITQLNNRIMLKKYLLIAIAPYTVIIPICLYMITCASYVILKLFFVMILLFNLLNLPLEFISGDRRLLKLLLITSSIIAIVAYTIISNLLLN